MHTGGDGTGVKTDGAANAKDAGDTMSNAMSMDGSGAPTDAGAAAECIVAMHVDTCCHTYEPVTRAQLTANKCLLGLPATHVFGNDVALACVGPRDAAVCDVFDCYMRPPPPSRVAVPDGKGGCRYADECTSDADCVVASITNGCCDCPESMPASLLASNPCLLRSGDEYPGGATCPGCSLPVECGMCAPPEAPPHCTIRDSFSLCE